MSKIFTFIFSVFLALGLHGQEVTFNFSGTITFADGAAVEGQTVLISSLFSDSSFIFVEAITNELGAYAATTVTQTNDTQGVVDFSTTDCSGNLLQQEQFWSPNSGVNPSFVSDFIFCDLDSVQTCSVIIVPDILGAPISSLTAVSPAFPLNDSVEFVWNTGETESTIIPQTSGVYCVTATFPDIECIANACYNFAPCGGIINIYLDPTDPVPATYTISADNWNGTPPYDYVWSDGSTNQTISGLTAGSYCVTVSDELECTWEDCLNFNFDDSCSVLIISESLPGHPFPLLTAISSADSVEFIWSNGEWGNTLQVTEPGFYCISAYDFDTECTAQACISIQDTMLACGGYINTTSNSNDSSLYDLQVIVTSGTAPFTYNWANNQSTTAILEGVSTGVYCVAVTDANGCSFFVCDTVLNGNLETLTFHFFGDVVNFDGSVEQGQPVFINGETTDSGPFGIDAITDETGHYDVFLSVLSNDFHGVINFSVINCNGAFLTQAISWQVGFAPGIVPVEANFVTCSDINIDSCSVLIVEEITGQGPALSAFLSLPFPGGSPTYVWSNGDIGSTIFPTESGTYCVTATSANCQAVACYDFIQDTTGSCFGFLNYNYVGNDSMNNGGSFTVEVNMLFGTAPYTYSWNTGELTQSIVALQGGTYCVEVTDANGCVFSDCIEIIDFEFCEVFIGCDPPGSFQAFGFGVEPFQYLWSTGDTSMALYPTEEGEYCVTITDATGCEVSSCAYYEPFPGFDSCFAFIVIGQDSVFPINDTAGVVLTALSFGTAPYTYAWNTGETTATINASLSQIDYCVTITDADSCVATACTNVFNGFCEIWVEVNYNNNNSALLNVGSNNPSPIIDIMWSNGEVAEFIEVNETGSYCVTVMFENGCMAEACVWVDLGVFIDSCFSYLNILPDSLEGGFYINVQSIGEAPFTYQWTNGATTQWILVDSLSQDICATVTDASGCTFTTCLSNNQGFCEVYVDVEDSGSGNTFLVSAYADLNFGPYQYLWSTGETTSSILVDVQGEYCVTVTSALGCSSVACTYVFPDPTDSISFIVNGFVIGQQNSLPEPEGTVYAYHIDQDDFNNEIFTLYDSTEIGDAGFYQFDSVEYGLYIFKAVLDQNTDIASNYFPTYHLSSLTWEEADLVFVPFDETVTTDIQLISTDTTGGGGLIGGSLVDPTGLIAGSGDSPQRRLGGLSGIEIILEHQVAGPFRYAITDLEGNFTFDNLPWGTYKIVFDYPGVTSPETWVTLSPNNAELTGVTITSGSIATSTSEAEILDAIKVFPNPTNGNINIDLNDISGEVSLKVLSITGQMIEQKQINVNTNERIQVDLSNISSGMYLIQLITEIGQTTKLVMRE